MSIDTKDLDSYIYGYDDYADTDKPIYSYDEMKIVEEEHEDEVERLMNNLEKRLEQMQNVAKLIEKVDAGISLTNEEKKYIQDLKEELFDDRS